MKDLLGLWVELLHFLFYPVVDALVEDLEDVVLFLYVCSYVLVVFLLYELLPVF